MNREEIRQEYNETAEITTYDSLRQYIDQLVEKLSPKRKEIFVKSRFDGLSIMEIAIELATKSSGNVEFLKRRLDSIKTNKK